MPQTSVTTAPLVGAPGEPADGLTARIGRVNSRTSEEASANLRPGVMVQKGTGDYGVKVLTATTNKLVGIVVRTHDVSDLQFDLVSATGNGYKPGATVPVASSQRWFVLIEENVAPGLDVRVRCVVAGSEVAGAFRTTADSTDCIEITPLARWVRTALAADGVGELEIDMSNIDLAVADT